MRTRSQRLPQDVVEALRAYLPPGFDFAAVRIRTGVPRWAAGNPLAVTVRNTIYFAPGCFDAQSPEGVALLVHELAHVEQFRRLGFAGFVLRYLAAYAANRLRGHRPHAAYLHIPLEIAARERARSCNQATPA